MKSPTLVPFEAPKIPDGYALLEPGDKFQSGDLFYVAGWQDVGSWGGKIGYEPVLHGWVIRKVGNDGGPLLCV